jgi:hypothetical protein
MYERCCALILGLLCCVASAAHDSRGFYAGAGVSRGTIDLRGTLTLPSFERESTGLKLLGGYRLGSRFAVEGMYLDLGRQRHDSPVEEFRALTMAAAGALPIGPIELHGRAGLGYWRSELSREPGTTSADRYIDPYFGAGIHYRAGRVTIRGDFDLLALRLLNALDSAPRDHGWFEAWSVGVTWHFR